MSKKIIRRKVNIDNFVRGYLPPEKRLTNYILNGKILNAPLSQVVEDFLSWRDDVIMRAKVTGQHQSLEWYLNEKFDNTERRITTETNYGTGLPMGLRDDEDVVTPMGDRVAEDVATPMRRHGEHPTYGFANFGVNIPAALTDSTDDIKGVVDTYRLAGKTFVIVET